MLWVAPTGSVTAPFVPYWIAGSEVLPEFGKHRYLTKDEATLFVTPDFSIQEASLFAGRLFKRLMYYTCDAPARFLPEVTEALTAFEDFSISQARSIEARALALFEGGHDDMARAVIDEFSGHRAEEALELGEALLASIEARSIEARALALFEGGHDDMARAVIDEFSGHRAEEALELGEALLASIEARHRLLVGYRAPEDDRNISTRHGPYVTCEIR